MSTSLQRSFMIAITHLKNLSWTLPVWILGISPGLTKAFSGVNFMAVVCPVLEDHFTTNTIRMVGLSASIGMCWVFLLLSTCPLSSSWHRVLKVWAEWNDLETMSLKCEITTQFCIFKLFCFLDKEGTYSVHKEIDDTFN